MNWLAHLALARDRPLRRLGQLAADFVKGPLDGHDLAPELRAGVDAHRRLDVFTDTHPAFRASVRRLAPALGRVAGIAVDVAYDHLLSRHWQRFHATPRRAFIDQVYDELARHADDLPPRLARIAPRLAAEDWLGRYADLDDVAEVLRRIDGRIRFPTALPRAGAAIASALEPLDADFLAFYPSALAWADVEEGVEETAAESDTEEDTREAPPAAGA